MRTSALEVLACEVAITAGVAPFLFPPIVRLLAIFFAQPGVHLLKFHARIFVRARVL